MSNIFYHFFRISVVQSHFNAVDGNLTNQAIMHMEFSVRVYVLQMGRKVKKETIIPDPDYRLPVVLLGTFFIFSHSPSVYKTELDALYVDCAYIFQTIIKKKG